MSVMWTPPYREISLTRANNRDYFFSFEDMNGPVAPIFGNNPNASQRPLYEFPQGTAFKLRAKDEYSDIRKEGAYDPSRREIKFSFLAEDTLSINKDRDVYYEMDAFFPDGSRYTILTGVVSVMATRNLNG